MRLTRVRAFAILLAVGATGCSDPTIEGADPDGLFGAGVELAAWDHSVVRARQADPRFDVTGGGFSPHATPPERLRLNLFEDASFDARLTGLRRTTSGVAWEGELVDGGVVTLAVARGSYAGTVRTADALFQIGKRPSGHYVAEIDEQRWDEHPPLVPQAETTTIPIQGDGGTQIDVMVVYTADAKTSAGGQSGIEAVIDLAVAETNQGYEESGVGISLQLVHRAEVDYSELQFDWSDTLTRLQGKFDGVMDEVHGLRDQYGADHVVLIVDTVSNYAGIGYQMQALSGPFFADYAFSVVARSYATGAYTFGHELGHNMGANHDHDNSSDGFFPYSHGRQVPEAGYRTVMAYPCSGCTRVNRWSSPLVTYNGVATGIADKADNARSLNGTAAISAGFRTQVVGPPTDIAVMVSPKDGTQLSSDTETFVWDDVGALSYHLDLGSYIGDDSYHDGDHQGSSATVGGLPEDASAIYARLWSESATAGWVFNDYKYIAADPPPMIPATLISPAPGSVLDGSAVTFVWQQSQLGTRYQLRLGTTANPSAYHDAEYDVGLDSAAVSGLPTDGSAIVASMSTLTDEGAWLTTYADYTATTQQDGPPFLSPLIGTILSGITETFRWEDFGAFQYWLEIKLEDGTHLFNGSVGGATEYTFTGLPTDGSTIEVTVYADVPVIGWVHFTATFTAAS